MKKISVKVKLDNTKLPHYASEHAAGADILAKLEASVSIKPLERVLIPTGLYLEIPPAYEVQIRPRSGLAIKHGVTLLNAPGTIDADYRGELKVILVNFGHEPFTIQNGDRIAQMVLAPVLQADFLVEDELSQTIRGSGGFGSTGI